MALLRQQPFYSVRMKIFKGMQSFQLFSENALMECYTSDKHFIHLFVLEGTFQKLAKLCVYVCACKRKRETQTERFPSIE